MNPNDDVSGWLEQSETLDEIKEESVEIKEEPIDGMVDIKLEDLIYNCWDRANQDKLEIREGEYFDDVKYEESIIDDIKNESMEIKEEPIHGSANIKEEDPFTLPIADIFCPSTGNSRPLNIGIDEGRYSKSQIVSHCGSMMNTTKMRSEMDNQVPIIHREEVEKINQPTNLKKCDYCNCFYKMGFGMEVHVRSRHPERKCYFCTSVHVVGAPMNQHVRSMHPEKCKLLKKCALCQSSFLIGSEMNVHVLSMHSEELEKRRLRNMLKQCDFCDSSFTTAGMSHHVKAKHPVRKCNFCASSLVIGAPMNHHVRTIHPGEFEKMTQRQRLEKCPYCDSFYKGHGGLMKHVRAAHPQKKCVFCATFHVNGAPLYQHIRSMHPEKIVRKRFWTANVDQAKLGFSPEVLTIELDRNLQTYDTSAECDFCGEETHSYLISPENNTSARRFFNNLELTQTQRASTVRFFQQNLRAIVCGKHLLSKYSSDSNMTRYDDGIRPKKILPTDESNEYSMKEESIDPFPSMC